MARDKARSMGKRSGSAEATVSRRQAVVPRQGGRPTKREAENLRAHILDTATAVFLEHGYGLSTIDGIARKAHVSKRTLYDRFEDKAALFRAVVARIVERLHPPTDEPLLPEGSLRNSLLHVARLMLRGAMSRNGLALYKLIASESNRFPELAGIGADVGGKQEAAGLIVELLNRESIAQKDPAFAAQQFVQMVLSLPQRRAAATGKVMTEREIDAWASDTVDLFLHGWRRNRRKINPKTKKAKL